MIRPLFLRLVLIDSLFACALVAARLSYHRHIHPAGLVAIGAVLVLYAAGSALAGRVGWHPHDSRAFRWLDDIHELSERLPAVAMLGTVSGFLIALSSDAGDLQHRAAGASTALAATFVGIACWLVLGLQHRLLIRAQG